MLCEHLTPDQYAKRILEYALKNDLGHLIQLTAQEVKQDAPPEETAMALTAALTAITDRYGLLSHSRFQILRGYGDMAIASRESKGQHIYIDFDNNYIEEDPQELIITPYAQLDFILGQLIQGETYIRNFFNTKKFLYRFAITRIPVIGEYQFTERSIFEANADWERVPSNTTLTTLRYKKPQG